MIVKGVNLKDVEELVNALLAPAEITSGEPCMASLTPVPSTGMDIQILRAVTILRDLDDIELQAFYDLLEFREIRAEERIMEAPTSGDCRTASMNL